MKSPREQKLSKYEFFRYKCGSFQEYLVQLKGVGLCNADEAWAEEDYLQEAKRVAKQRQGKGTLAPVPFESIPPKERKTLVTVVRDYESKVL